MEQGESGKRLEQTARKEPGHAGMCSHETGKDVIGSF